MKGCLKNDILSGELPKKGKMEKKDLLRAAFAGDGFYFRACRAYGASFPLPALASDNFYNNFRRFGLRAAAAVILGAADGGGVPLLQLYII